MLLMRKAVRKPDRDSESRQDLRRPLAKAMHTAHQYCKIACSELLRLATNALSKSKEVLAAWPRPHPTDLHSSCTSFEDGTTRLFLTNEPRRPLP